ncbi:MAG: NAD-dependent epimerase/dehydratase family protein [Treponema sp.]|nr:NAD-dependent epimerase/dehydratase family protein [Treponema sp.]
MEDDVVVAVTGGTGHMGFQAVKKLLELPFVKIKLLVRRENKTLPRLLREVGDARNRIAVVSGSLVDERALAELVRGTQYVVHMAAVIPPLSDKNPRRSYEANELGAKNIVRVIEAVKENQPKFIDVTSVALYGNRDEKHLWGRVGDPLLVSPFDVYSANKLRGEFAVLESNIANWAVLRQSAMIYRSMLDGNVSDGLMFHTTFNGPLEWVTDEDSGALIKRIIEKDLTEDLGKTFWRHVFNIGAPHENRVTGFETLDEGFKLINGSSKDFFTPDFNITRNFHGMWYYDSDVLDNMFHYKSQKLNDYWKEIGNCHKYYKLACVVPAALIKKIAIERLFKNYNAPKYWLSHGDNAKLTAFFGSADAYKNMTTTWSEFPLLCEGKLSDGTSVNYESLKDVKNARLLDYGFDFEKRDEEITLADLQNVAKMHGGECLASSFKTGDVYTPVKWKTQDAEIFSARPYSVLRAGHWVNPIYKDYVWDFDRLAKKDAIFAQIWYDTHSKDENFCYYFDSDFKAHMK